MTEPLRWSSIPTATPPLLLAAAPASPVLAWAGRDGEVFCQPSSASDPVAVTRIEGAPLALTLSATGDHAAWLTKDGVGWIAASGGEARRVPGTAGYGGVTFVNGHLLCAPSRAAGDVVVTSTHTDETRTIPLARLDLDGLAAILRDHGLGEPTEATALWIAIAAGLPEAREVVLGSRSSRRQVLGSNPVGGTNPSTLLVYLRGGRLVRIHRLDDAWHRTDLRPPRRERLAEGRDACLHPDGRHVAALLDSGGAGGETADEEGRRHGRPASAGR